MSVFAKSRNCPSFGDGWVKGKGRGESGPLYTWYAPLSTPTQPDIERDGTEYYWPLDDATPNTSVSNYAGTKTLTKAGAGTINPVTDFDFNSNGKGVSFAPTSLLQGDIGAAIGTQDFYVEFDYSCSKNTSLGQNAIPLGMGPSPFAGDLAWSIYFYGGTSIVLYMVNDAAVYKTCSWTGIIPHDGTRHRLRMEVDRDSDAGMKCFIDGVELTRGANAIDDYSGLNLSNQYLTIGSSAFNGTDYPFEGEISQVKLVIGSCTGSTSTFKKGLDVDTGSGAITFTRTTAQTGEHEAYNPNEENIQTQIAGNPVHQRLDPTSDSEQGILIESESTNYAIQSRALDNVAWTAANVTVTADDTEGPDGVKMADKLVSTAANGTVEQTTGLTSTSEEPCFSVWLKADAGTFDNTDVVLEMEDSAAGDENVSALLDAQTGLNATVGTDWKHCYVFAAFSAGVGASVTCRIKMITNGLTIYADMAQCAVQTTHDSKKTPSSFIYTVAASVTRTINAVSIATSAISTNINKFSWSGMFQMNFPDGVSISENIHIFTVRTNIGDFWWYQNTHASYRFAYLGTAVANWYNPSYTYGQWVNIGGSVDTVNDIYTFVVDGNIEYTGVVPKGAIGAITGIYVGSRDGATNICLESIAGPLRIYDGKALSNAEFASEYADMKTKLGI
ncbi:MAG: hypothetical protein DRP42_07160 [Tenericutes bacterium]|nr:MAG: hypothetical protein DRP42_07160 [Mycoplasmatota bacterium]